MLVRCQAERVFLTSSFPNVSTSTWIFSRHLLETKASHNNSQGFRICLCKSRCGEMSNVSAVTPSVKLKCINGADYLHPPLAKHQLSMIYHGMLTVKQYYEVNLKKTSELQRAKIFQDFVTFHSRQIFQFPAHICADCVLLLSSLIPELFYPPKTGKSLHIKLFLQLNSNRQSSGVLYEHTVYRATVDEPQSNTKPEMHPRLHTSMTDFAIKL